MKIDKKLIRWIVIHFILLFLLILGVLKDIQWAFNLSVFFIILISLAEIIYAATLKDTIKNTTIPVWLINYFNFSVLCLVVATGHFVLAIFALITAILECYLLRKTDNFKP